MKKITFNDTPCNVVLDRYTSNNQIAIELFDAETHEPFMTASVAVKGIPVEKDETLIKDYSENKGILQELINNKYVEHIEQIGLFHKVKVLIK